MPQQWVRDWKTTSERSAGDLSASAELPYGRILGYARFNIPAVSDPLDTELSFTHDDDFEATSRSWRPH